jgi:hypothetical protein
MNMFQTKVVKANKTHISHIINFLQFIENSYTQQNMGTTHHHRTHGHKQEGISKELNLWTKA